jgi:signal transduction histidine kinase
MKMLVASIRDITPLKEVERAKDAFVSNVSHELRTPITSIKLNQSLLALNPERQEVYLARQAREIDRLNILIEDLLRLSRLDQSGTELNLAPTNLNTLVEQHVDDRSPLAESRSLTLVAAKKRGLPLVQADGSLIGQALSVLLTNALNYTPPGGTITLTTAARKKGALRWAGFSVSDTGPGIPDEDVPHLFERFFRGRTGRDSKMPGTGLGLAIAHKIVSRHGGRIEAGRNTKAGQGAVFSVWLPVGGDSNQDV